MQQIIERLKQFDESNLTYETLGNLVKSLNVEKIGYENLIPALKDDLNYTRNILLLDPLECVILHWPPNVESAVHYHDGFYGYVLVLEGTCDNVEYKHQGDKLYETQTIRAMRSGVLDEPDGTIHKIKNPSSTEPLVTCHFYYPALDTLDGLVMYDTTTGDIGTLNEKAASASFNEPIEHFRELKKNAFEFQPKGTEVKSHTILPILPKPRPDEIRALINDYYAEQAAQYDMFDLQHESRRKYIRTINTIIAEELDKAPEINEVLAIACGTGRRAAKIRAASRHDYNIFCVDLNEEMCCQATERNVETCAGSWLEVEVPERQFCMATFLYAFGHIPTKEERRQALARIYHKLKEGGVLFLDVFNTEDQNEWGPSAVKLYHNLCLGEQGYELGDVFYKKSGGQSVAYLHYFDQAEITSLLESVGFKIAYTKQIGYVHRSGEIFDQEENGALFVKAVK